ncbi:MAG TPA: spore germination protein GerW family protein [Chloroflexota bacterium]|jgi:uncharacterized spore protein YtfJ
MTDAQTLAPLMDKVYAAAMPGVVFSSPVESSGHTIITATEVWSAGGFGMGSGQSLDGHESGGGGGGGGASRSRPVAAIVIGPDGVKVEPILDVTQLALAGIAAWGAILVTLFKIAKKAR